VTPKLAIIAYPVLEEADLASIQSIRATHDPQFPMLDPHFTLVFPIETPLADIASAVGLAAAAVAPFPFTLGSVRAVRDVFGPGGHVFLVPDHGAPEVIALHTRLYSGALRWAHRADIPYVPHITVAAHANFSRCEALAQQLARHHKDLSGRVEALTVVEVAGAGVKAVATSRLAGERQMSDFD
jgi:2'-5' RNA ligase